MYTSIMHGGRAGTQQMATIRRAGCELLQASPTQCSTHWAQHQAWPTTRVDYAELNRRDKTFADFLTASIWEFKCISHSQSLTINLFRRKNMYAFLQTVRQH